MYFIVSLIVNSMRFVIILTKFLCVSMYVCSCINQLYCIYRVEAELDYRRTIEINEVSDESQDVTSRC